MTNGTRPLATAALAATSCLFAAPAFAQSQVKTAATCEAEYKAEKAALKSAKEKKKTFITACRALPVGTPTPVGTAAAPSAPAVPPMAQQAAAPASTPATVGRSGRSQASVVPGASACGDGYAHLPVGHTATQFCDEAQAKAHCGGTPVVWVNTSSKIYHLPGQRNYGHTKEGAYECQTDATAEGDRQTKNGQ